MKLVLLDAAPSSHPVAAATRAALAAQAASRGWTSHSFFLPDIDITDCAGDFKCWTQTPGVCAINDANRVIARAIATSDVLVLLTPVTFGGYASGLKKALDHLIQDISPFFEVVGAILEVYF